MNKTDLISLSEELYQSKNLTSSIKKLFNCSLLSKKLIGEHNFTDAFELLDTLKRAIERKKNLEFYLLEKKLDLLVEIYFEFAFVCFLLGKKKISHQAALRALELREQLKKELYPGTIEIYQLLLFLDYNSRSSKDYRKRAYLFRNINKDQAAIVNLIRTISFEQQEKSLNYSKDCLNLAWLLAEQNRSKEASLYAQAALVSREETLSQVDSLMIPLYLKLSEIYLLIKNFNRALFYAKKHLYLLESTLQKNDPELAEYYLNIVLLYQDLGELEKAGQYLKKTLKIYANNPSIVNLPKKVAQLETLSKKEDYYKANLELTLEIQEQLVKEFKRKKNNSIETVSSIVKNLSKDSENFFENKSD